LRGVFQEDTSLNKLNDFTASGFVFAPFDGHGDTILISGIYEAEEVVAPQVHFVDKKIGISEEGREAHLRLVDNGIAEIEKGTFKKVVLSRSIDAATTKNPLEVFSALLTKYPNAFCYCWYHPSVGIWLGATPEQLLQYQNGEVFTTSLAGTLPVKNEEKPGWTPKEVEEQQMVTDYIEQNIQGYIDGLKVSKPKSLKAGKLWHLETKIKGKLKSYAQLGELLKRLHPTPAVCGFPKEPALDFIVNNEDYDREFYTGYLGPLNLDKPESANLFVNLRCFKYVSGNQVKVFVGGGITASSNAIKEWKETQFKSRTVLEVL